MFAHKKLQPEDVGAVGRVVSEGLGGVRASEEARPREPEHVVIKGPTTWSKSWPRHVVACDLG